MGLVITPLTEARGIGIRAAYRAGHDSITDASHTAPVVQLRRRVRLIPGPQGRHSVKRGNDTAEGGTVHPFRTRPLMTGRA
ncbi:MAG: hypothetical protein ACRDPY_26765 [Streptosporangiaceae bacterium]